MIAGGPVKASGLGLRFLLDLPSPQLLDAGRVDELRSVAPSPVLPLQPKSWLLPGLSFPLPLAEGGRELPDERCPHVALIEHS